ncbi:MAG: glycosyltransferase family 4 protein [Anaerolineaceae bacterium]
MRVLYFTRDYTPHDYRFLSALAGTPHRVYYLRLERSSRQIEDRSLPPEVEQVHWLGGQSAFKWRAVPALWYDLRKVLGRLKPDIVHAGPVQSAAFLTALSGFQPLVSMSWGSDLLLEAQRTRWMNWVTRYTLHHTCVLVGDCQAVRQKAESLGFAGERVMLFPWGVDLQHFVPGASGNLRSRLGWEEAFILLSLRSWEPVYGVDLVVRAFIRAARQIPDLRLLLLGGGSQAGMLRQLLAQHDLNDRVYFGGQTIYSELPHFCRAADAYLSASHSDGSSVSLMEALASGLPALVSDIPGNKEWITPGVQGWLFPDGDEDALVESILQTYRQRGRLAEIGKAARRLAEQRADWTENFKVLLKAYDLARMGNQ